MQSPNEFKRLFSTPLTGSCNSIYNLTSLQFVKLKSHKSKLSGANKQKIRSKIAKKVFGSKSFSKVAKNVLK
jgi:hypothetical protein